MTELPQFVEVLYGAITSRISSSLKSRAKKQCMVQSLCTQNVVTVGFVCTTYTQSRCARHLLSHFNGACLSLKER